MKGDGGTRIKRCQRACFVVLIVGDCFVKDDGDECF